MDIEQIINWLKERSGLKGDITLSFLTTKISFKDENNNVTTLDFNGQSKDIIIKLESPEEVRLENMK
jgi:hypothetical protein